MKVVGVGLNRTGTKTLRRYLLEWGYAHRSYELEAFERYRRGEVDSLLDDIAADDSCEDWPWPLLYREIDERFPDARFILTTRKDPETWYRSLCNLAVRMGPLNDFERHIYGYSMPHGHREEHFAYYDAHNRAVRDHFAGRPGKLLEICWETSADAAGELAAFLGHERPAERKKVHANKSSRRIYSGDNLLLAHLNRVVFQAYWYGRKGLKGVLRPILRRR